MNPMFPVIMENECAAKLKVRCIVACVLLSGVMFYSLLLLSCTVGLQDQVTLTFSIYGLHILDL